MLQIVFRLIHLSIVSLEDIAGDAQVGFNKKSLCEIRLAGAVTAVIGTLHRLPNKNKTSFLYHRISIVSFQDASDESKVRCRGRRSRLRPHLQRRCSDQAKGQVEPRHLFGMLRIPLL